jgi:hypothetical protein
MGGEPSPSIGSARPAFVAARQLRPCTPTEAMTASWWEKLSLLAQTANFALSFQHSLYCRHRMVDHANSRGVPRIDTLSRLSGAQAAGFPFSPTASGPFSPQSTNSCFHELLTDATRRS